MPVTDTRRDVGEPKNRLSRIANSMLTTGTLHGEHDDADRFIVMIMNGRDGTVALHGYNDNENKDTDAMADLLVHVEAVFRANGKQVSIAFIGEDGTAHVV